LRRNVIIKACLEVDDDDDDFYVLIVVNISIKIVDLISLSV
jgi:hypothetical protein